MPARLLSLLLCTVLATALTGCKPGQDGPLVLGTAEYDNTDFLPFEGDHPLVPGSQGGFHIWVKIRVAGIAPGRYKLSRMVRRVSDDALILGALGVGPVDIGEPGSEGYYELPMGVPSFICPPPLGVEVIDQEARFKVTLSSYEDESVLGEDEGIVTMHCPDNDQLETCMRVCSPDR